MEGIWKREGEREREREFTALMLGEQFSQVANVSTCNITLSLACTKLTKLENYPLFTKTKTR